MAAGRIAKSDGPSARQVPTRLLFDARLGSTVPIKSRPGAPLSSEDGTRAERPGALRDRCLLAAVVDANRLGSHAGSSDARPTLLVAGTTPSHWRDRPARWRLGQPTAPKDE
jgi:hypothetical protein